MATACAPRSRPSATIDVTREIDLIEEVGRLHGFDQLPRRLPAHGERGGLTRGQTLRRRLEDALRDIGFDQAISWGLISPDVFDLLRLEAGDARRNTVRVSNPLSEELSVMRTTLLGGLLDAARRNLAHGMERASLFESGRAYFAEAPPAEGPTEAGAFPGDMPAPDREPHRLAAHHRRAAQPARVARRISRRRLLRPQGRDRGSCPRRRRRATVRAWHPSPSFTRPEQPRFRSAASRRAGWASFTRRSPPSGTSLAGVAFEFDVAPLLDAASSGDEVYEDLLTHPALLQDLAVVVPEDVPAERVRETVLSAGGELLRSAEIFDLYRGDQVGEGKKSLALRLEFRAQERTLTDEEVAPVRSAISDSLEGIGGSLRG